MPVARCLELESTSCCERNKEQRGEAKIAESAEEISGNTNTELCKKRLSLPSSAPFAPLRLFEIPRICSKDFKANIRVGHCVAFTAR